MRAGMKRVLTILCTLFLVSLFVFLAFGAISGDAASRLLGTQATPERLAALRAEMGLDAPQLVQYFRWLGAFVTGDMGTSYSYSMPVSEMLAQKLPLTGALTLIAFFIIVCVSIPLGIVCAKREGGLLDRSVTVLCQIMMAVPPSFTGILFTYLFGLTAKLFVVGSLPAWRADPAGHLVYLFFPALAVALPRIAMTTKLLRSAILTEAARPYVRTSMSRGMSRTRILYAHVLRNAAPSVVTFLAMTFADIVAGSVVVEQIFVLPGIGRLLLASISNRDAPVVQAIVVLPALVVVLANLAADALNRRIDPRLRSK